MSDSCWEKVDQVEQGVSRLVTQFRESSNLISYIKLLLEEANNIEEVGRQLFCERWVSTAIGAQLDIIGVIVGQPRSFAYRPIQNFGFEGSPGAQTFGTSGATEVGGLFRSITGEEFEQGRYDDDTYRIMIKTKILRNRTNATIEEIIYILLQGVSVNKVHIEENLLGNDASFKATFIGTLSQLEKILLTSTDYAPKPCGVSISFADDAGDF